MTAEERNYCNVHAWLRRKLGTATKCVGECCEGKSKTFHWALKKGCQYEKNIDNFIPLCVPCHRKYDFTEEMRKAMVESRKGKIPPYMEGSKLPHNTKEVVDIATGKSYPSMKHAAAAFGVKYETLMNNFRPGRKNKTNLRLAS